MKQIVMRNTGPKLNPNDYDLRAPKAKADTILEKKVWRF